MLIFKTNGSIVAIKDILLHISLINFKLISLKRLNQMHGCARYQTYSYANSGVVKGTESQRIYKKNKNQGQRFSLNDVCRIRPAVTVSHWNDMS